MRTQQVHTNEFEFYFPEVDTLVLVEDLGEGVVIRAALDTFSEPRKVCFIHELAAEGFISDDYKWFSSFASSSSFRIRWVIDKSWIKQNRLLAKRTNRLMLRLTAGAALLWMGIMAILLFAN
jgi:hypothetical protein